MGRQLLKMSAGSGHRAALGLVCVLGLAAAFVALTPWPIGFGAAVATAAAWCARLEREQRPAKLCRFPQVRSVPPRRRRTVA